MLTCNRILLPFLLALLPCLANAQLAQGFRLLEQADFNKAIPAFESVLSDNNDGPAAKYGLATCYLKQAYSNGDLAKGFAMLRSAKEGYKKLSQDDKGRYASKYKISAGSFDRLMEELQTQALAIANNNMSLLQLDTLMENMTPMNVRLQKNVEQAQRLIVPFAVENAKDYATLGSLVEKHYWLVTTNSFKNQLSVHTNLWYAFLNEYGYPQLDKFVKDHPREAVSIDCWVLELSAACKPPTTKTLLRFLIDYPNSTLDFLAEYQIGKLTKKGSDTKLNHLLDAAELNMLENLKLRWQLDKVNNYEYLVFDEAVFEKFMSFITKMRSTRLGYDMVQDALEKCLSTRQWDMADKIVAEAKPLFPDFQPEGCKTNFGSYHNKQQWFSAVTPIVNKKAEGIYNKSVKEVNTRDGDEYSPIPTSDGRSLYFVGKNRELYVGGEDIFVTHYNFETKEWSEPALVESLCTRVDESPVAITFDGNEMLLFREGKLYSSKMTAQGWGTPVMLPKSINDFAWIGEATFNDDGNVMIFAASETTPGLFEESNQDLYLSKKGTDGVWGTPVLLSTDVNTFDDERSPYLYPDNKTLYFSSNGHAGLGSFDIFYTKRLDDTWLNWSIPKNLGKEVNSLGSNWGYTLCLNPASWEVYSSKSDKYTDLNDIYVSEVPEFARPARILPFSGRVVHPVTGEGIHTQVVITNPETGASIDTIWTRPGTGEFTFPIPAGLKTVSYHVMDKNLFPNSKTVSTAQIMTNPGFTDVVKTSSIEDMIRYKIPASLNNITFDYDKSELKPESYPELERLFNLFNNQSYRLEISGHTDNAGSADYNLSLSQRRADAVKNFLVKKGLPADRMSTIGHGADKPVDDNDTEEGRAQNRRVEVRISK